MYLYVYAYVSEFIHDYIHILVRHTNGLPRWKNHPNIHIDEHINLSRSINPFVWGFGQHTNNTKSSLKTDRRHPNPPKAGSREDCAGTIALVSNLCVSYIGYECRIDRPRVSVTSWERCNVCDTYIQQMYAISAICVSSFTCVAWPSYICIVRVCVCVSMCVYVCVRVLV